MAKTTTVTIDQAKEDTEIPQHFGHHVILYAKGWYGESTGENHIIEDLKKLLAGYSWIPIATISERDVWEILTSTFEECVSLHDRQEGLFDMLGKKWSNYSESMQRKPEEIMIGKISIVSGKYVDPSKRMDVSFDNRCHGWCNEHQWLNGTCGCPCNCIVCKKEVLTPVE